MRRLALPFLLLIAALTALPAAAQQLWLSPDTETQWVPFTLNAANQIRFTATIGGTPVAAILDTGVSDSVVSRRFAGTARLHPDARASATAIGGSTDVAWMDSPTLAFGGFNRRGGRVAVIALPASATGGETVDLLVGRDLLASFALDIDYDGARFRLLPSGRMPFRGTGLPLAIGGTAPTYFSDVMLDGRPARMIVDTGDGNAVTLSAEAWRRLGSAVPVTSTLSYGVGGSTVTGLAVVHSLDLGALHSGPIDIAIEAEGGFSQNAGASGRIGTGFLRRYRVLLDPAARHIVLAPGKLAGAAPLRSTSGLLVVRDGDVIHVLHVMRKGPAAEGGWRAGDTICSVDGVAVKGQPNDAPLRWPVGTPGTTVRLGLCDGSERALTLRAFY